MTRFTKVALSGLTALSLALTPLPAAADSEDVAKALAGLAVLGIIAAAANDRNKRKEKQTQQRVWQTVPHGHFGSIEGGRRVIQGEIIRPGSSNLRQHRRAALPDRCLRIVSTSRGNRAVYGNRCLRNNFAQLNRLPERCRVQVRTDNRVRNAFAARCLRREGWQVAQF